MKYLNKIIAYGLYLLVFLLPLQTRWIIKTGQLNNGPWEYGTYSLYATDVLLIFVLLLFIIQRFLERRISNFEFRTSNLIQNSKFLVPPRMARVGKIQNYFIGGLVLASAASIFFAADKPLALYKFGWLILGVGLYWLVVSANYDRLKLIYAMLAGAFLSAGLGIWQFLAQSSFANKWLGLAVHHGADLGTSVIEAIGADGILERWLRAYGSLDHPNILGGLLTVSILFLVAEIIKVDGLAEKFLILNFKFLNNFKIFNFKFNPEISKMSAIKISGWILLLVFTAGLFFSFSRSAWLALASGLAVMVVLAVARGNLKLQKSLAEVILVMGILLFVLFSQYQNLIVARLGGEGRLEAKSNSERLASYQEAWQIIKNNWLGGVGLGSYTLVLRRETPEPVSYFYQPTHNVFMLAWAETGIFGLLFFLGLIIYIAIFNFQFSIFKQFSNPLLKIKNCLSSEGLPKGGKLKIGDDEKIIKSIINLSVLTALIVLFSLDHWLFSLHFGVLFFWLIIGLVYKKELQNNCCPILQELSKVV